MKEIDAEKIEFLNGDEQCCEEWYFKDPCFEPCFESCCNPCSIRYVC